MYAQVPPLSPEEYLELETQSATKHEYFDGEVVAMAGATDTHVTILLNLASDLRSHLRGSGCRVFIFDMKLRIDTRNCFFYPDIFVTCDERDRETNLYKSFPKIIIEVLSVSTELKDRGEKFNAYRTLPSLQEYVLINCQHYCVEIFRRHTDGLWLFQSYEEGETFRLESLDYTGTFAMLYEDASLEAR
ncbi:Uma2 family endonuclease [Oscillatoria sp. FACHB-1406]|uniref:Uma2 family endonuclease n=1 Tax=Oscillatoria sp. FACHB-1406 TaxID=2692846 RepID=UPI001685B301|nr:Uma2 family endonuclease [Oscillatoria sp. FACHB-1406]MBD2576238.1 Uma2 family endonuclease [Oscillatoria sp. FACHB-1406]